MGRTDDYLVKVGNNIRFYRQILEMSQDELGQKVGYTNRAAICAVEAGKRDIPNSKLVAIAQALHVSVSQLLDETNKVIHDKEDAELLNAYHHTDEKTKRLVAYMLGIKDIVKDEEG